jgi:hypothetical protein
MSLFSFHLFCTNQKNDILSRWLQSAGDYKSDLIPSFYCHSSSRFHVFSHSLLWSSHHKIDNKKFFFTYNPLHLTFCKLWTVQCQHLKIPDFLTKILLGKNLQSAPLQSPIFYHCKNPFQFILNFPHFPIPFPAIPLGSQSQVKVTHPSFPINKCFAFLSCPTTEAF